MNDTSRRNLSAILGVACVVLIIAAGALLATSGESASPSLSGSSVASVIPSDSGPIVDSSASPTPTTPSVSSSPTVVPTGGPTATPAPKAPVVAQRTDMPGGGNKGLLDKVEAGLLVAHQFKYINI